MEQPFYSKIKFSKTFDGKNWSSVYFIQSLSNKMILNKNILIIFLLIFSLQPLISQTITNSQIIDSLFEKAAVKISDFLKNKGDSINLNIINNSAASILKQKLAQHCKNKLFDVDSFKNNHLAYLEIIISDLSLKYENISDDKIRRKITLKINTLFKNSNNLLESLPEIEIDFKDTVSRDSINLIDNQNYNIAHSKIPEQPKTFFQKILEPAIVVGSAAITVLLLFKIRSN